MKKAGLFTWIFTATLFSVSPLTSLPAKAEGGCPKGLFPVGGGYCRNIVCPTSYNAFTKADPSAKKVLDKYNQKCPLAFVEWGNIYVPMR